MREFLARNGARWQAPSDDPEGDQTVAVMELVAAGELGEAKLAAWSGHGDTREIRGRLT